ncbi:PREDICTED: uncharacterized protein LOC108360700 [Rhagoletis zephyria]|uniref:uncharacterized protein LOC108360700 n=1 Tax=Rhagoletis zephyria TaxID=28612 RepID=UPI0008112FA6|nr:PREDICTED: uncharacterized protein LOC108360700 [Rhagoletis zephyria]
MGRTKSELNNQIRSLFEYSMEENVSLCKICKTKLAGQHSTNLRRHIETKHKSFLNHLTPTVEKNEPPKKKIRISYEIDAESFESSLVKIITKDGQPLSQLDSEGFREIVNPIFKALNMNSINSHNVMELVNKRVVEMKKFIKKVVEKKLVSIKIDTATRFDRSILGINLQYLEFKNSTLEIVVKTLGMKTSPYPYTGEQIQDTVLDTLAEYDIRLEQIYCVTSDNGRNMLKAVEIVNQDFYEIFDCIDELPEILFTSSLHSMRCAVYSLQLCVTDIHKDKGIQNNIEDIRKVCELLRNEKYRNMLTECNRAVPPIDIAIRWNSTYVMVKQLLELRDFVEEEKIIVNWDWIQEYVSALEPIWAATMKLQVEQLPLCDLFKIWMELKLNFRESRNGGIKQIIYNSLLNRESLLLSNVTLLSAVYLDPRLNVLLTESQKSSAKANLKSTARQIFNLKQSKPMPTTQVFTEEVSQHCSFIKREPSSDHESSLLSAYLDQIAQETAATATEDDVSDLTKVFVEIDNFENLHRRLPLNEDIFSFYQNIRFISPELFELALVVLGAPATQASVERAFSSLNFVLSESRNNLNNKTVEDLLLVRLNT